MQSIIQLLTFISTTIVSSVNQVFSNSQRPTVSIAFGAQEVATYDGQTDIWEGIFPLAIFPNKDGNYQVLISSVGNFTYNNVKIGNGSIANVTVLNGTITSCKIVETSAVTRAEIATAKTQAIADATAQAATYADAADVNVLAAAAGDASAKANAAINTANAHSDANDVVTLDAAKAYADGVGTVSINTANAHSDAADVATLNAAKADATAKSLAVLTQATDYADTAAGQAEAAANTYTDSKILAERQLASLGIKDRRRVEITKGNTPSVLPTISGMLDGTVVVEVGVNDGTNLVFETEMDLSVTDMNGDTIVVQVSTDDALIFENVGGVLTFVRKLDNRLLEAFQKLTLAIDDKVSRTELAAALQTQLDYIVANLIFADPNA